MAYKIINQYRTVNNSGEIDDCCEIAGIKSHLDGHEFAQAIFGTFRPNGRRVVYSQWAGDKEWQATQDELDSCFIDDMTWLLAGKAQLFN